MQDETVNTAFLKVLEEFYAPPCSRHNELPLGDEYRGPLVVSPCSGSNGAPKRQLLRCHSDRLQRRRPSPPFRYSIRQKRIDLHFCIDTVGPSDSRHGRSFDHRIFDDLALLRDSSGVSRA
jgi:hypothetical protein